MKEKTIRLGIIGMGGMGGAQLNDFAKLKGVKIVAGADPNQKRALEVQKEFKIKNIYLDYKEMLEKEQLDAVTNVTSDAMHYEVAMAVLARKIPILSEKPLAANLDQAKKMAAAAKKSGVINMVNFSYRSHPALQAAAKLVRSGKLGKLLSCEASYMQSWELTISSGIKNKDWPKSHDWALWRISKNKGGSGAFGDVGCHILDMTTFLCNDEIDELSAFGSCRKKEYTVKGYDLDADNSFATALHFRGGGVGVLTASHSCIGQSNSLRVRAYFEKGAIEVDLDNAKDKYLMYEIKNTAKDPWKKLAWKEVKCPKTLTNYERFIKAVRSGKPSEDGNNFENGCKIQAYLHYGFLSAEKKSTVKVK